MKFVNNHQSGYSLVEVLIAISILLITIVGPLTIAQKGLQNASFAKQQNTAFFLAQEALESVIKIREDEALQSYVAAQNSSDTSFNSWEDMETIDEDISGNQICTSADPCGVDIENGMTLFLCAELTCDLYFHESGRTRYQHDAGGTPTPYRRIVLLDSDQDRVHVRSIVTWGGRDDQKVELETFVYNIYAN
jgi:prepilin-type N-terminal cleavage/methylation domain-containing protein